MSKNKDLRSQRRPKHKPFIKINGDSHSVNIETLIQTAKLTEFEGFEDVTWDSSIWTIDKGRLVELSGRNKEKVEIEFKFPPGLGAEIISSDWQNYIKSLFRLRFHRSNQCLSNQRNFIASVSYVAFYAIKRGQKLDTLTSETLNEACRSIAKDYASTTAYNMHKAVAEFASYCDVNMLSRTVFDYKYSGMKRPEGTGGVSGQRLDDPEVAETSNEKLIPEEVYKILGELYKNVPKNHKYRFFILILVLIACLGRRISEITLIPDQELQFENGKAFLMYFKRKASEGDTYTPIRPLYIPTAVVPIIGPVIEELRVMCKGPRLTAVKMLETGTADIDFLKDISPNKRLYINDLEILGISGTNLGINGWIRKKGYAQEDETRITKQGKVKNAFYTTLEGVIAYCKRDFSRVFNDVIHKDQTGKKYYLKDLMLVKYLGMSSGAAAKWIATLCTHSMMTTFLRSLPALAEKYASKYLTVEFTSHHFRHTMNTLLDEGGLTDLLQTEWFGRTNANDTKAYQHTSREKRALMLRADLREGRLGGAIAEQYAYVPVNKQEAFMKARITAVHDVGTGVCVHSFSQTSCPKHLQCTAKCDDYTWIKNDSEKIEEVKKQYAITYQTKMLAEAKLISSKPGRSSSWLEHLHKKLETLLKQLNDFNIFDFDPIEYMKGLNLEK